MPGLPSAALTGQSTTLVGLAIGLLAVPLLAGGTTTRPCWSILLNRLIDGLDGAIARQGGPTPFGGYLDIVCDIAFYAAVPLGFALAAPANALWAAVLLASFVCTARLVPGPGRHGGRTAARPTTARAAGSRSSMRPA